MICLIDSAIPRRWDKVCNSMRYLSSAEMRARHGGAIKATWMCSHVLSRSMIALSSTSLYCFSVQQGPVRDCGVQIPWQARRLCLGRYPSHPDPLFQAAEAHLRRLCQLRPKVGSISIFSVRCWIFFCCH